MKIKIILPVLFIAQVGFLFTSPLAADSELTFHIEKTLLDEQGRVLKNQLVPGKNIEVHLGKNYFTTNDGSEKNIFDFKKRQIFKLNSKSKTYREFSLYSLLGFRVAEIENRNMISKLVKKRTESYYIDPVFSEHALSVRSELDSVKLNFHQNESGSVYQTNRTRLAEFSKGGKSLSHDESLIFLKFLRYQLGGHPEILDGLLNASKIPEDFSFYFYNDGVSRLHYSLLKLAKTNEEAYSLNGYSLEESNSGNNFGAYLNKVSMEKPGKSVQKMASVEVDIQDAVDHKKYLEAILGCMESGLYNSQFDIDICQKNILNMQKDPNVKIFFKYLNTARGTTPQDAYDNLKSIESAAGEKVYILRIFEANMMARMGKPEEAYQMIFDALKKNPYITGAYKDLGELFYNNFRMDLAWMCWDIGRKIYPEHSMMKEISQFEEDLLLKYPEYF